MVSPAVNHNCPRSGCAEQVAPDRLACPRDWFQLPPAMRSAVNRAWDRGRGRGSAAHRAAISAAIRYLGQLGPPGVRT
jgi:hypothetical protein